MALAVRAPIHRLQKSKLGLQSFGAIAQAIAARAAGFGMSIVAHPYLQDADIRAHGATPVLLDELIEQADYLVIQARLRAQTKDLIGEVELQRMKPGAVLINTARGPIVTDAALYRALSVGSPAPGWTRSPRSRPNNEIGNR